MKQILISMHINRDLHALRFALIFFFCSENLRLFYSAWIHKDSLRRQQLACTSLFVYTEETSSTQSVHWYSIRTCNHSRALYRYTLASSSDDLYLSIFLLSEYYSTESNFSIICYRSKSTFAVYNLFKTYSLKIYSTLGALK